MSRNNAPAKPARVSAMDRLKASVGLAVVLAGGAYATSAAAQTTSPSQTQPGATAVQQSPPPNFTFPPAQGLTAPAGAESVRFALSGIDVDGQFPELQATSAHLQGQLVGRTVSVADIYGFAANLQQAYFAAGFPLARVVVPPQQLGADGHVHILVVDGFVEAVDTSHLPSAIRRRVADILAPLVGARHPSREALERRVLLAGDTAGLSLSSALAPGNQVGGAVLVLSGDFDAVSGVIAADNRVDEQLGRYQLTTSVAFNGPFGMGEQFFATYAGYPEGDMLSDNARRRYVAVGGSAPIGVDGLLAGASADYSTTRPQGNVAAQKLSAEYARFGVWVSYPLIRSRTRNLTARAAFDVADDIQRTDFGGPTTTLSADRVRALRLTLQGDARVLGDARLNYSVGYSNGFDVLGARTKGDATALKPLSRQGADATFKAFDASASLTASAPFGTNLTVAASGRYSFNQPLLRSEQFSPAGADGLSGPPPGDVVGDSGAVERVELSRPTPVADNVVAPYAFVSNTNITLEKPTALERDHTDAQGLGLGVRWAGGKRDNNRYAYSASLEWAHVDSNDHSIGRDWISASVGYRF